MSADDYDSWQETVYLLCSPETPGDSWMRCPDKGGTELSRQAANRCGLAELQSYVHIPTVMSQ
jgi:hypothetical protein